ncbi:dTDP-glucose 4,6-dehydratase [Candidatus Rhabdochlamydia porcellionis]|jgi:dTDP-glucose 4,6-dehydratase|uniref:dTDP-glucose 4,6-dehydratase n=1 Tax=Candidatus Rhabdochlamydia porcellionis TaxID=225148 RepID=A0ABX8Z5D0_9BACT|nr:dTDP-glucose 4,6-dehydratase [Candidatus Rhabdochlamydia porcellionis]QZA59321.1 dTDP-glucose 4 [Candidatus Rhabdochlamydia porcellionis]
MRSRFKSLLVTGGAGFIGSCFIRYGLNKVYGVEKIINLDALTYAGNMHNLEPIQNDGRHVFVQADICDQKRVAQLLEEHQIEVIVHFAAESHVDRSILGSKEFLETNVGGTLALLDLVRLFPQIHFHHVSTDEVYGSLTHQESSFKETSLYKPNSPYAASKAAADHFVRAYAHTYKLLTTISHCSNNYGPCQHPEKFIPRMIAGCLHKSFLPIYGEGMNIRDWLFVEDHVKAIWTILGRGVIGESYAIGGGCEKTNIDVLYSIIDTFSALKNEDPTQLKLLIKKVADRPGHDLRYSIDATKIKKNLDWTPMYDFESSLKETIRWYLEYPKRLEC